MSDVGIFVSYVTFYKTVDDVCIFVVCLPSFLCCASLFVYMQLFTERVSTESNAIGFVRPSVRPFVSIIFRID